MWSNAFRTATIIMAAIGYLISDHLVAQPAPLPPSAAFQAQVLRLSLHEGQWAFKRTGTRPRTYEQCQSTADWEWDKRIAIGLEPHPCGIAAVSLKVNFLSRKSVCPDYKESYETEFAGNRVWSKAIVTYNDGRPAETDIVSGILLKSGRCVSR